jgi:inosose dehydratase
MEHPQKFSFGYHLNSWDLGGLPLEDGLRFLAGQGFRWFEPLSRDTFSTDFSRRNMGNGYGGPPKISLDIDWLGRIALFSRIKSELGLNLSSLYLNADYLNPHTRDRELATMTAVARVLAGFGSPVLVMGGGPAATPGSPHTSEQYAAFARALGEIGSITRELGIWTAYHPHLDCFIETRDQLDRLMEHLDPELAGLCIDPAHLEFTKSDPVKVLHDYGSAVRYMHFKDVAVTPGLTGPDRFAAFCELGAGDVDLPGLAGELLAQDYDGLVTIELDVSQKGAETSTLESIAYVHDVLGLAINAPLNDE